MNPSLHNNPPRVIAVALNPALDHTLEVNSLRVGEVNRALRMQVDVGGKGINVASCLADFGIPSAVTGQIGRDNAAQFETLFHAKGIDRRGIAFLGNRQYAEALFVKLVYSPQNTATHSVSQRLHAAVTFRIAADGQHFFYRTLGHHLRFAVFVLYHSRQTATGKVKGNFIYFLILFFKIF